MGTSRIQKTSGTKGSSNKKQSEQKVGDNTESKSDDGSKRNDYVKALRDLKLQWFKCVGTCKLGAKGTLVFLLNFRSGVLAADELNSDFEDNVDFLMAKLKRTQSEKVRRVVDFVIVGTYMNVISLPYDNNMMEHHPVIKLVGNTELLAQLRKYVSTLGNVYSLVIVQGPTLLILLIR